MLSVSQSKGDISTALSLSFSLIAEVPTVTSMDVYGMCLCARCPVAHARCGVSTVYCSLYRRLRTIHVACEPWAR